MREPYARPRVGGAWASTQVWSSIRMSEHQPHAGSRRPALLFIFFTVLIDVLAFGLIIPVLPHVVERLAGGTTSTASYWIATFGTVFALIQFVMSPIQGALSDRFRSTLKQKGARDAVFLRNQVVRNVIDNPETVHFFNEPLGSRRMSQHLYSI